MIKNEGNLKLTISPVGSNPSTNAVSYTKNGFPNEMPPSERHPLNGKYASVFFTGEARTYSEYCGFTILLGSYTLCERLNCSRFYMLLSILFCSVLFNTQRLYYRGVGEGIILTEKDW